MRTPLFHYCPDDNVTGTAFDESNTENIENENVATDVMEPATGEENRNETSTSTTVSANDFETDMQTIRDYVRAVAETKNKIATSYLSAIDNFQTTVQSASPAEARPDILGTVLKTGLKTVEKMAVTAVKEVTQADLGPLVDLVHAIYDEVDRASKAAQNLAVSEWIKNVRTSVTNAYTQDQTGEQLRAQIEREYNNNDEGGRGGYIAGIQIELEAITTVQAPREEIVEVAFYTSWINQNFNSDCIDGTGFILLQYEEDGSTRTASVVAPLGDKVAGALNNRMAGAGINCLMDLDVVKKLCQGDICMCYEGNNVERMAAFTDEAETFLSNQDNWKKFRLFS